MASSLIDIVENNRETIVQAWLDEMSGLREEHRLDNVNDETFMNKNRDFINQLFNHFEKYTKESNKEFNAFIDSLLKIGWPLSVLTQGLQVFRRLVLKEYVDRGNKDALLTSEMVDRWFDPVLNQLISHSMQRWEDTISVQRNALRELSAPLIPVVEGIGVMPLIGAIDTERAKYIMENLLNGVIEHRAQVVLIDITGVPVVDTMVAHHIIQAAEAVRLVGAQCILVGIRPEIAQTIVSLGIELGNFPTKNTLKKGIQMALEMTDREIVDHQGEDIRENSNPKII